MDIETTKDTKPSKESRDQKYRGSRARILEQIDALGWHDQNTILVEAGFTKFSQNLSLLKKNEGDLDRVLQILKEKQEKKAKKGKVKQPEEFISSEDEKHYEEKEKKHKKKKETIEEEKNERDEKPKKEKKEKRPKREDPEFLKKYEEWPADVTKVFLDGNNMLFVDRNIMKMQLARKKKQAERAVSNLAMAHLTTIGGFNTVLVYDSTRQVSKNVLLAKGKQQEYVVCSASPGYSTSDDALVDWMNKEAVERTLVVTSDRELQRRLNEKNVKYIMKTGNWFKLVKAALGEENYAKAIAASAVEEKEDP